MPHRPGVGIDVPTIGHLLHFHITQTAHICWLGELSPTVGWCENWDIYQALAATLHRRRWTLEGWPPRRPPGFSRLQVWRATGTSASSVSARKAQVLSGGPCGWQRIPRSWGSNPCWICFLVGKLRSQFPRLDPTRATAKKIEIVYHSLYQYSRLFESDSASLSFFGAAIKKAVGNPKRPRGLPSGGFPWEDRNPKWRNHL